MYVFTSHYTGLLILPIDRSTHKLIHQLENTSNTYGMQRSYHRFKDYHIIRLHGIQASKGQPYLLFSGHIIIIYQPFKINSLEKFGNPSVYNVCTKPEIIIKLHPTKKNGWKTERKQLVFHLPANLVVFSITEQIWINFANKGHATPHLPS